MAASEQLFLFDVDGTLVRLDGAGRRALEAAFRDLFAVPEPRAAMNRIRFDGSTDRAILNEAVRRMDVDPEEFARRLPEFEACYLQHLEGLVAGQGEGSVLPSVLSLLETLEAHGATLGLLTGNTEAGARTKLAQFDLNRFFPAGAFGSDHRDRVVLAGMARRRLEQHAGRRFRPRDVFVVGDSVMDVRCGRTHGFRTVAVATGWTSRELLAAERPDHLLEDLGGLLPVLEGTAPGPNPAHPR
jgi:phosphoglycolate phosphatase-like HAD superfamily hydrolase